MIALFLLVSDPLLDSLREMPEPPPRTCPFNLTMTFDADGEENVEYLRIDPETETMTRVDANGDPLTDEEAPEASSDDGSGEDDSVSLGAIGYEQALDALDFAMSRVESEGEGTLFRASDLPKGTIELSGKDLSKNASVDLRVSEGAAGPFISEYRERLDKPIRMRLVAKIQEFERAVFFGAVDGSIRPIKEDMRTSVSAMGSTMEMAFVMDYDYPDCASEAE
ncbi:MAG: hypothetical protein AAGH41_11990 [Pseudomonadota bacterium]